MILQFDPNQSFQLDAIKSIVDLFEGQPLNQSELDFTFSDTNLQFSEIGVGNRIVLNDEQILKNLQSVQKQNEIKPASDTLDGMHFSVEMETGTGKTYVYLRTIYELNKNYGFKKFVIVVPSVAIREGVIKNLQITNEHFQNLYDKTPVNFEVYDSGKVSNLRSFATNNNIQILVINIDSFAKDENIINKPNDKLTGKKPIEFIQYTNPIVIVDEPQNMETPIRKKAIENLNYCCTLRYSATHTNFYNLVYSLNPVQAYDLGLVKHIEVDSVVSENDFNDAFISLERVSSTATQTSARIRVIQNTDSGVIKKAVSVKVGDDLFKLSNYREIYKNGYIINEIDVSNECISLSNGDDIFVGESRGGITDEIMKFQIEKTIEEHFKKERILQKKGIKVLSLFFIDRVANYRKYDDSGNLLKGKLAVWFEEIFNKYSEKIVYKDLIPFPINEVHNGYFAQDKKGHFKDSQRAAKSQDDIDTFKLIMKEKEKLLDANEPLRFIFSHSALREGWDNPNVFQICTLNETKSELKKRQEIGRGLRLSVNQNGERIFDNNINRLTVIANESYEDFAKQLQKEIEDDCGVSFKGRIKNKRDRVKVEYRKGFELDENFKEIWERIKYKTTYRVNYKSSDLIDKASNEIKEIPLITKTVLKSTKTAIKYDNEGIGYDIKGSKKIYLESEFSIPDVLNYIQNKTGLTRSTILQILRNSNRLQDVLINPQLFMDYVIQSIKDVLNELIIDGIKYEKIGNKEYEMHLFDDKEIEIYLDNLVFKVNNSKKTIYENIIPLDSNVEYEFAKECETRDDIEFYFKLPFWFHIKTPIGKYNPDWALIKKNETKIYFVAETKSENQQLRKSEEQRIQCGKAHFREFDDVTFRGPVSSVSDID
ncbi:MAG: DEAD/DEAH box helicase family protein [Candidatus Cloacimonadales bacterium]|nr:DEAD/DEAH box helicase family protein [Candidatus Cloacimonadales bacterium]